MEANIQNGISPPVFGRFQPNVMRNMYVSHWRILFITFGGSAKVQKPMAF